MYQGTTLGVGDSLLISAMGIATVFICLLALCLAIMLFSKIFSIAGGKQSEQKLTGTASEQIVLNEEEYTVLLCAVSEETRLPLDHFKITQITPLR